MDYKRVILIGAGPGDPELLTVKALRAIQGADIVVYDRLVSEEIIALIPRGIPKIYAGKSCKHKAMSQQEINSLLITLARKYSQIARLKGGDPFLFGRGGEEMLALRKAGIKCEVIPGITSAQGCAATAGIPLTHRGLATGVKFITGHTQDGELVSFGAENYHDTTLVIYMGIANLGKIVENLMAKGLNELTPAAIIEKGTTPQERIFTTNLISLPLAVIEHKIESPALVIIGKVAAIAAVTKLSHDFSSEYDKMSKITEKNKQKNKKNNRA